LTVAKMALQVVGVVGHGAMLNIVRGVSFSDEFAGMLFPFGHGYRGQCFVGFLEAARARVAWGGVA